MENASKALIIAGAILLSIAIIGIGMYVYQMAASTIDSADMSGQQVTAYNSEFVKYEGTQKGTNVRALCDAVISHNTTNSSDNTKQILVVNNQELTGKNDEAEDQVLASTAIYTIKNGINAGSTYKVTFNYSKSGLIKKIGIKKI